MRVVGPGRFSPECGRFEGDDDVRELPAAAPSRRVSKRAPGPMDPWHAMTCHTDLAPSVGENAGEVAKQPAPGHKAPHLAFPMLELQGANRQGLSPMLVASA